MKKQDIGFATFSLEHLALGLLMAGPNHGYQLYQDYVAAFSPIWLVGRSKFYAALTDLQAAGLAECVTEPQPDRPPRKTYHLTEAGRGRFLAWLHEPVTPVRAIRVEMIAKLRFFDLLGLPGALDLIDAQADAVRATLDGWRSEHDGARRPDGGSFFDLMYGFREKQARFILDWLQDCRRYFEGCP